jgi:hypothetical protein
MRKIFIATHSKKVFNTPVQNAVEKYVCIFVSDSARVALAVCTAASAGTFGVRALTEIISR